MTSRKMSPVFPEEKPPAAPRPRPRRARNGGLATAAGPASRAAQVTAQKEIEDDLRRSREDLARALEVGQMGWWRFDARRNVRIWSPENHLIIGGPPGPPPTYEALMETVHPDDREYVRRKWAAALQGEPYDIEHRIVVGGRVKWVREKAYLEFDAAGALLGGFGITQDISALKRTETEMLRLNRRLQALMDAVPVGVSFSEDATCRRIGGNAVVSAQFEFPPADNLSASAEDNGVYGRRIRYFRDGRELSAAELPLQRAVTENRFIGPMEIEIELPSGRRWIAEASGAPVRDESGRVVAGISVTVDITQRKRIEQALRTANERLREADRRKDEFLAMLSHELRGPLAPIRNGIAILRQAAPGSPQAARALDIIDSQTGQLTGLVDDLLDLNLISRGRIELHKRRSDFAALVHRAVDDHRADFEAKSVRLEVEAAGPLWIDADPTRIGQIVGNLVGNAWKFTPPGGRVDVQAAVEDGRAVLRVRDTGSGIAPGLLGRVFDPFTQAEQTLARSQGGLGLGLVLVKRFVEMHGGTVSAASDGEGRGAEFTVRLPLLPAAEGPEPTASAARTAGRLRILVVEDYADAAESLKTVLEILGHEARIAADGAAGLAAAREMAPDLVLCDIGLPDMDGYAVAREIRCDSRLAATRLVALTGYAQPEDAAKAVRAGFDLHAAKPLGVGQLQDLLASIAASAAKRRNAGS